MVRVAVLGPRGERESKEKENCTESLRVPLLLLTDSVRKPPNPQSRRRCHRRLHLCERGVSPPSLAASAEARDRKRRGGARGGSRDRGRAAAMTLPVRAPPALARSRRLHFLAPTSKSRRLPGILSGLADRLTPPSAYGASRTGRRWRLRPPRVSCEVGPPRAERRRRPEGGGPACELEGGARHVTRKCRPRRSPSL